MADGTETDVSDIQYEIKPGLFKEFCERAQNPIIENENIYGIKDNPEIWKISLKGAGENEVRRDCFDHDRIRIGWDSYGKEITDQTVYKNGGQGVLDSFINQMEIGDIVLTLYDNKTIDAIGVVQDDYDWLELETVTEYKRFRRVKWIIKDIRENIIDINGGKVLTLSSVYRLSRIQLADVTAILSKHNIGLDSAVKENKDEYVFIIDEINRGNISKIFGELITLIECTKRLGAEEAMTATLPYSPKPFGVPSNVYVLGTMNTADRSIALMDTALRRRFEFIEMMPKAEILSGIQVGAINIKKMLETMNERIEYLYDREHTIGHSYFLRLTNDLTLKNLSVIFKNSIIPLLQEYFYEDYSKIQLVLGDNGKDDEFKF
ncbi:MAG: AAA family ATPase, partial [Peptostreptococcaceae bacterium]|nr:AAA family ATPase [Peptostreptococcaceae bacterium]